MIFGNVVRVFSDQLINQYIGCIIDDHSDPENISILQDAVLKVLIMERDINYERFIQSQKTKKAEVKLTPPTKFTEAFRKSVADRVNLKKKHAALRKKHDELIRKFNELKTMCLSQIKTQKEQSKLIEALKESIKTTTQVESEAMNQTQPEVVEITGQEMGIEEDDELFTVQYV